MTQPIACTLTPEQLSTRTDDLAALAARALRSRERTADGVRLIFTPGDDTERELRAAIAAEARCCPFLTMDLRPADDALVVDISGPEEARPIVEALFAVGRA